MHDPAFVIQCRAMEALETDLRDSYFDLIEGATAAQETHAAILSALRGNQGPSWMIEHMEQMLVVPHLITQWREDIESIIGHGLVPTVTEEEAIRLLKIRVFKTTVTWSNAEGHVRRNRDTPTHLIGDYYNEYVPLAYALETAKKSPDVDQGLKAILAEDYGSQPLIKTFGERFGEERVSCCTTQKSRPVIQGLHDIARRTNACYRSGLLTADALRDFIDEGSMLLRGEPLTFSR